MEKQNLTVSLPRGLIRKAKLQAVQENKSLNQFVREAMEYRVELESGYQSARQRHLKILKQGYDMGTRGSLAHQREELHERE